MSVRHNHYRYEGKATAATVDERKRSIKPVTLTEVVGRSKSEPDESFPVRPSFREDFLLEHSRFGKQADSRGFVNYF